MRSSRTFTSHVIARRPRRLACVAGLALAASLAVLPLAGCGADGTTAAPASSTATSAASSASTASGTSAASSSQAASAHSVASTTSSSVDKNTASTSEAASAARSSADKGSASASKAAPASSSADGEVRGASAASSTSRATAASSSSADRASSSSADESASADAVSFSYSDGLNDEGHWDGITALDYVTLPEGYDHLSVPSDQAAATDDEVQAQIDSLASSFATTSQVTDRAVQDGDTVNIDYVGSVDGVEFDGGSTNGQGTNVIAGSTQYVDDFLQQIIGHKPGETFDVDVTFPDDYSNADLAGKDATFKVTINYITEKTTPEITDDWVQQNLGSTYGWTTVDEMKQSIRDSLDANKLLGYLQNYVMDNAQVSEIPQELLDYQVNLMVSQYQQYATSYGTDLSSMLQQVAGVSTVEELAEKNHDALEAAAKNYLVYQAIAEDQGITVSAQGVANYFQTQYGTSDYSSYESTYGLPYLKLIVMVQDVNDLLKSGATVEG